MSLRIARSYWGPGSRAGRGIESSGVEVHYSDPAVAAFVLIPTLLAAVLVWGTGFAWRRSGASDAAATRASFAVGGATVVWMAATWLAAQSGILRLWDRTPPPFGVLLLAIVAVATLLAFGAVGRRLALFVPLWLLVAVQGFRLPLELAMHAMYERGVMPVEMSFSGRNFDVVSGATALVVAALVFMGRGGRRIVAAWNVLGLALLVNVVVVALLGTPRFRYFGDHLNVWVTYPPFVWLPAVMVLAALAGHLVIFGALRQPSGSRTSLQ